MERFLETVDEDNKGFVLHEGETTWYYSLITDILAYHNSKSIFQIFVEFFSDSELLLQLFRC